MQSPLSDCESMLTEFGDPNNHRYYANNHHMHHLHHLHHNQQQAQPHLPPPAMFYAPPPPEHPPPSDVEPDSPTMSRLRGAYHPQLASSSSAASAYPHLNSYRASPYSHGTLPHSRNKSRANGQYSDSEQPYGGGSQHYHHPAGVVHMNGGGGGFRTANNARDSPHGGANSYHHNKTMSPPPMGVGASRAYSPQAMSEPERGPTPPTRGYTLGSPHDDSSATGGEHRHHYSDTEGAPVPPLRMNSAHAHAEQPPSPAPEDSYDPTMDRGIQSSLPSLVSERHLHGGGGGADSPSMSEMANFESDMDEGRMSPSSEPGENDPLYAGK